MDVMAIAGMSVNMRASQLQQQVSTSVLKKGMDAQTQQMSQLINGFVQSNPASVNVAAPVSSAAPSFGHELYAYA